MLVIIVPAYKMNHLSDTETLDSYVKNVNDQNLKGLLLKLRNEIRKEENSWKDIKSVLLKILKHDSEAFDTVIHLILLEEY